jgi:ribulose 1,5-bisphosphate carboxylase large subunit-like protein
MLAIATYGSVYKFVSEYQVIDMEFPSETMAQKDLVGPRFGGGIVQVEDGSTRLGLIIKPRFASDERQVRELVRSVAEAGVDYVIDDELTVRSPHLSFERRVRVVVEELGEVASRTGRSVPYFANVTGGYGGAMERARLAHDVGAAGIMVNTVAMGYDVVADIAADADRNLAIVANSIGRGVMTSGPLFRVAPELLCKLARLSGADAVYTGPLVGSTVTMTQRAQRFRTALTDPYHQSCSRRPAVAVMSGGLGLPEIVQNESLYRGELMLSLGRDFIQPLLAGLPATTLMECLRGVWRALRDEGKLAGQSEAMRLAAKGPEHRSCLLAIRAEEAVT